jgi:hypothetical protein
LSLASWLAVPWRSIDKLQSVRTEPETVEVCSWQVKVNFLSIGTDVSNHPSRIRAFRNHLVSHLGYQQGLCGSGCFAGFGHDKVSVAETLFALDVRRGILAVFGTNSEASPH